MDFVNIDQEKCLHDGKCASVCIHGVLQFNPKNGLPFAVAGMEQKCVTCGHCVSICPTGAFSHSKMPVEKCPELTNDWRLSSQQVEQLLKGRRTTRQYKNQIVDSKVLSQIIEAAKYAPTGYNIQPVKWIVIYNTEEVRKIAGTIIDWMKLCIETQQPFVGWLNFAHIISRWEKGEDLVFYNVPHLVLAAAPKELPISLSACTMSLTYLELAALPFGLGSCWAGLLQMAASYPPMQELLNLPEGFQCFGAMMIGYPKNEFYRIPMRKEAQIIWK